MPKLKKNTSALIDSLEKSAPSFNDQVKNSENVDAQVIAFNLLTEVSHIGFFIFQNSKFIYKNKYAAQLLSRLEDEIIRIENDFPTATKQNSEADGVEPQPHSQPLTREYQIPDNEQQLSIQIIYEQIEHKKKSALTGIIFDITEQKKQEEERRLLQEQLFQAQKTESLNSIARGLSHDFNNILSSILGNITLAKANFLDDEKTQGLLENIKKSAQRGVRLVSELLVYSQPDLAKKKVFNLNTLISDSLGICKTNISKKIVLHHQLKQDLPAIETEMQQIQQVFITTCLAAANLIGDKPGILTITTGVQDITAEDCEKFQGFLVPKKGTYVFYEIHTAEFQGSQDQIQTFLDLSSADKIDDEKKHSKIATTLNIIQSNHGFIKVQSEKKYGTSFRVFFPATSKPIIPKSENLSQILKNVDTILLVDDEEIVQITLKRILKKLGYSVFTADDGKQAVELFREFKAEIDLILLDLTMPVMSGEDALSEIREIDPDVNVILFSGFDEREATRRLQSHGVAGFMEKPTLIDELGKRVQELFTRSD